MKNNTIALNRRQRPLLDTALLTFLLVLLLLITTCLQAQSFKVLHKFLGGADGGDPRGDLVRDETGNLFGTTSSGGTSHLICSGRRCGTIFELDKGGKKTILHNFQGGTIDGGDPNGSLVMDSEGNLYGTTLMGGGTGCGGEGCGTAFTIDKSGNEIVLHSFMGGTTDGGSPFGGLLRDSDGTLYGTTMVGGGTGCQGMGCGTVFKIDATGKETILYAFSGVSDGAFPTGSLIQDEDRNLYGTTEGGGAGCGEGGCGTVYKLDPTGKEIVLHAFKGTPDGAGPAAGVIRDASGNFYGTTAGGGTDNQGTVFKLNRAGKESVVYSFAGSNDGMFVSAGVVRDKAGNLYGTTYWGGAYHDTQKCPNGCGTLFEVNSDGNETILINFGNPGHEGGGLFLPDGGLIFDRSGNLYGSTSAGGKRRKDDGNGALFEFRP